MLVLIAGISGDLGTLLAAAALRRGFRVRGSGQNREDLGPAIISQLESFVTSKSYHDIPALDKAVASVDAVICAYRRDPILDLEAHLLLLHAAERAGVKIFHASSWTGDWRKYDFGEFEDYDTYIAFKQQAELTSTIKPVYVFTGIFAESLLTTVGPGMFLLEESGAASVSIWDRGDAKWSWTAMEDAAEFSIDVLTRPEVQEGKGGYFSVKSADVEPHDVARAYENITGTFVEVKYMGTRDELYQQVEAAREKCGPGNYQEYLSLLSQIFAYRGKATLEDAERYVNGKPTTTLKGFLRRYLGFN